VRARHAHNYRPTTADMGWAESPPPPPPSVVALHLPRSMTMGAMTEENRWRELCLRRRRRRRRRPRACRIPRGKSGGRQMADLTLWEARGGLTNEPGFKVEAMRASADIAPLRRRWWKASWTDPCPRQMRPVETCLLMSTPPKTGCSSTKKGCCHYENSLRFGLSVLVQSVFILRPTRRCSCSPSPPPPPPPPPPRYPKQMGEGVAGVVQRQGNPAMAPPCVSPAGRRLAVVGRLAVGRRLAGAARYLSPIIENLASSGDMCRASEGRKESFEGALGATHGAAISGRGARNMRAI